MIRCVAVLIMIFVLIFSLIFNIYPQDKILNSLGEYKDYEYYSEGVFQDFTDYAKYYYDSVDFSSNEYFSKIGQSDMYDLNEHLDDFESWIETYQNGDLTYEIVINYDFDRNIIDKEDYFYIYSEKHTWDDGNTSLVNYDVYIFDIQSNILYYFHNNV